MACFGWSLDLIRLTVRVSLFLLVLGCLWEALLSLVVFCVCCLWSFWVVVGVWLVCGFHLC